MTQNIKLNTHPTIQEVTGEIEGEKEIEKKIRLFLKKC